VGQHHQSHDTWLLTQNVIDDIVHQSENYGGHAMIITGFDDAAIAIDPEGHQHQGLLTLRNSWGNKAGDEGDFYMSYDYFKVLAFEIERIRSLEHAA
nr:peptidase C1 [Gammaproteobacteria bacterium]